MSNQLEHKEASVELAESRPQFLLTDAFTNNERHSPSNIKAMQQNDTAALVKNGTIPQFEIIDGQSKPSEHVKDGNSQQDLSAELKPYLSISMDAASKNGKIADAINSKKPGMAELTNDPEKPDRSYRNPSDERPTEQTKRQKVERQPQTRGSENTLRNQTVPQLPVEQTHRLEDQPALRQPYEGPKIRAENHGATPEFAARVQRQIDQLPANVRTLLVANGTKLAVGELATNVFPDLYDQSPRGWLPGATMDSLDGLYRPNFNTALILEHHKPRGGDALVSDDRAEGVLNHEVGHAVDNAMGGFSSSDDFRKAYDRDVAKLSPEERESYRYELFSGGGKSETFAEVFGALNGSSSNQSQTQDILQHFPKVAALLQSKLQQYTIPRPDITARLGERAQTRNQRRTR